MKKIYFFICLVLILSLGQEAKALSYAEVTGQGKVLGESIGFYPYPSGSLVNDSGTVYFIGGTTKIPFASSEAFIGLGYSFGNVIQGDLSNYTAAQSYSLNTSNMAHPWGSWLIYKGTVYYSSEQGLIGVPSGSVFTSNGGNWNLIVRANSHDVQSLNGSLPVLSDTDSRINATQIAQSGAQANTSPFSGSSQHAAGTLINDNGTIYLIVPGGKLGIPDLSTFKSWNYSFDSAIPSNAADHALPQVGVVYAKVAGEVSPSIPDHTVVASSTSISAFHVLISLPHSATAGTSINGLAATDPRVSAHITFDWGDGNTDKPSDGSSAYISSFHTYQSAGQYIVNVVAVDGSGKSDHKSVNIIIVSPTVVSSSSTASSIINYDVNGDTQVNVADFQKMVNAVMGTDTTCGLKCDLNGDGQVNVADLQKMINYLTSAGIIVQPVYVSLYDLNADGSVNVADLQKLSNAVMGTDTACGLKCDLNGDGQVNVADLQKMINYLMGITPASAPTTISLSPSSGVVGATVIISGTGFTPNGNTITFDTYSFFDQNSTDGKTLSFTIPSQVYRNCRSADTSCAQTSQSAIQVQFGNHNVAVINSNGTSNIQIFTVPTAVTSVNYDLNGDGQVNVADQQTLSNAVLGINTTCGLKCDLNGDGQVTVADLQKMVNYLLSATPLQPLPVAVNKAFIGGNITLGSVNQKIGSYVLSAPPVQGVNLKSVVLQVQPNGGPAGTSNFQNLLVKINGAIFGQSQALVDAAKNYTFTNNTLITLSPNSSTTLDLYADVPVWSAALASTSPATILVGCSASGVSDSSLFSCSSINGQDLTFSH